LTAVPARSGSAKSAPSDLEELRAHLPNLLVALDFDGTLAPIVRDPDTAAVETGGVDALIALADRGAQVAVVTGRPALTAVRLGGLARVPNLVVAGIYGAEIWHDGAVSTVAEPPAMASLRPKLAELVAENHPGVWVEDKRLSLVVHTRTAADPVAELDRLAAPVTELADEFGLVVHRGRLVLELRLPDYDKSTALRDVLNRTNRTALFFAGDDLGDLPAFALIDEMRAAGQLAVSVAVTSDEAPQEIRDATMHHVNSPAELVVVLRQLAENSGAVMAERPEAATRTDPPRP
jgi:trehalose 6-phosphate phosphatase